MPLDEFQKSVIAVVSRNRDSGSPFAGGAVIQQHGFRLTEDQDIFTAGVGLSLLKFLIFLSAA